MHSSDIYTELSAVLAIVVGVSFLMRILRQPLILGYILTGILVGPAMLNIVGSKEAFDTFSQIGITLLLFIIGLGLNITVIRSLGRVSLITAIAILISVGGVGALALLLFGFSISTAIIMGVALFFSSTIIILKVLSDKKEVSRLHGQIAIGVILIDDIVATLSIVVIAALGQGGSLDISDILVLIAKAAGLATALIVAGAWVMPWLFHRIAKNQELLFLSTLAWGFGIASAFALAGFSHEVGALFAGVSLASLPYATEMSSKLKPLRDFFIVLFFVSLGETFVFDNLFEILIPAIILSAIVLIGKPLFVITSLGAMGYTKLTSFKAGIHLSQISEFSIILVVFARQVGMVDDRATSIITLVALITITLSSYLMKYDDGLYRIFAPLLKIFERKTIKEQAHQKHELYTAILFGYHHGGHEFIKLFRDMKQKYLVVDYDPEIIEHLESQGIRHAYGDATDTEFLEDINAGRAKLVASTILDADINRLLLTYLHHHTKDVVFICHAHTYEEALELYEHGAAYVILPRFLGSDYITSHIKKHGTNKREFARFRERHISSIGKKAIDALD
ncbi:MAG: cation:proton antiporter [Candidatus Saccharimonadales bacterium]